MSYSSEDDNGTERKAELGHGTILFHMESEVERKIKEEQKNSDNPIPRVSKSRFELQKTGESIPRNTEGKFAEIAGTYIASDIFTIEKKIIEHLEHTLGKCSKNLNNNEMYKAVLLTIRDRLFETLNDTNKCIKDGKMLYCISMNDIAYPSIKNTLINLGLEGQYSEALIELGYDLEEICSCEKYDDDMERSIFEEFTTVDFPVKYYGFEFSPLSEPSFEIAPSGKLAVNNNSLWAIKSTESPILIGFEGRVKKVGDKSEWNPTDQIVSISYDSAIAGYNTFHTNSIKKFKGYPIIGRKCKYKLKSLAKKRYEKPTTADEKSYKLMQDYLLAASAVNDILYNHNKNNLSNEIVIHLTDPSGALTIIELFRVLLDEHNMGYDKTFETVKKTFTYEYNEHADCKYEVPLVGKLLPRHLEIVYLLNHNFLSKVKSMHPSNDDITRKLSWIEESDPKNVRLENICLTLCRTCLVTEEKKSRLFKEFGEYSYYKEKLADLHLGESHRKWIMELNQGLSSILTRYIGDEKWTKNFAALRGFEAFANDVSLIKDWNNMKVSNKGKLADLLKSKLNILISKNSLLDIILSDLKPQRRLIMAALYLLYQYSIIKSGNPLTVNKTVIFGIAEAELNEEEMISLEFIKEISGVINNDKSNNGQLNIVIIQDCNEDFRKKIIPAADLSEYLSPENSSFNNSILIQCAMNGCLALGTKSIPVLQLAQEVGKGNIFLFESSDGVCFDSAMNELSKFRNHENFKYLLSKERGEFESYAVTHNLAEECYTRKNEWIAKGILMVARCGKFSLDKMVRELANDVW